MACLPPTRPDPNRHRWPLNRCLRRQRAPTARRLCPRGRYSTCAQVYAATPGHRPDTYRRLYERIARPAAGLGQAFIDALPSLGEGATGSRASKMVNTACHPLGKAGGRAGALIPEVPFSALLASRKFRSRTGSHARGFDYIVEPDIFHDLFGHVPLLFSPVFSRTVLQRYGQGGLRRMGWALAKCSRRLYWYTIEFGLIRESGAAGLWCGHPLARRVNCRTLCKARAATPAAAVGAHHAHPLLNRHVPANLLRDRQLPAAVLT